MNEASMLGTADDESNIDIGEIELTDFLEYQSPEDKLIKHLYENEILSVINEFISTYFQTGRDIKILRLLFKASGSVSGLLFKSNLVTIIQLSSFV